MTLLDQWLVFSAGFSAGAVVVVLLDLAFHYLLQMLADR
jgi:hypothetical protein